MVNALLAGAKTQTRRVAKLNASGRVEKGGRNWHVEDASAVIACPHGHCGDTLWVREAFRIEQRGNRQTGEKFDVLVYRADSRMRPEFDPLRYKPSIHMPRAASRLTLRITDVRIERLQEISADDAEAEGWPGPDEANTIRSAYPIAWYSHLWDRINGKRHPWESNPWVWVVGFALQKETPK
jgi:hypothetical protein